ncbi:hypothetical protein GSI_11588 [Ganoderma sinense ZZ0214-1]|uniref:Uncharacterized protein n=1 Tax=Ganoderma sinense ZZ0214-1 TaxID=1077348 RepID=A0A2G8RWD9_9APHY|nr:hypothetical protein GSI_11588 [Ganoderma sinense ZZ0214-1]
MSTASIFRPPPTPTQVDMLRMLSSKIHYAFPTRPPVGSPLRTTWDDRFLRDVVPLLNILNCATFKTLPTLAMGCAWAANLRLREKPRKEMLDIDAIQPVIAGHPALNEVLPKGMKHLTYEGDDFGAMDLLPEEALPDRWWAAFASAEVRMDGSSVEGSHSSPSSTRDAQGDSTGASAGDVRQSEGQQSAEAASGDGEMEVEGESEAAADEPPPWFQEQFGVDKPKVPRSAEGGASEASASDKQTITRMASTRSSARGSKGKERAASPAASVSATASAPAAASGRTSRSQAAKLTRSASAAPHTSSDPAEAKTEASKTAPHSVHSAKTRSKSRAKSTDAQVLADDPASSRGRTPATGSSAAPIDVDAMDVDGVSPSPALRGRPIDTSHLRLRRSPIRARGSEFSYKTTSNRRPSPSPDRATQSPTESLTEPPIESPTEPVDATVPPVEGSWRSIPRLDDVLLQLQSATVAEHDSEEDDLGADPSPATLDDLQPISDNGGTALPQTELMKSNLNAVAGIVQCTKEWAETLGAQSKRVLEWSERAMGDERDWSRTEVVDAWFNESQDLGDDVARLSRQLADTNKWVSLLARCLKDLMASPIDGDTLEQVLVEVARLKYAYEDSVRKFAALQEDVRPVRREVHRLRWRTDAAEHTAEVAANEAARAIEPLLTNLYSQLSAEIDAVRIAVSRPMERLATTIALPGGLTPPMVQEVIAAIREAVAEMWRTTTSISKFIEGTCVRLSSGLSAKVRDLEERLLRVEGTGADSQLGGTMAAADVSLPQLARAIESLSLRVDALQREVADDQAFDRRVQESLGRIGLMGDFGELDAFDRRVQQSLARLGIAGEVLQRVAAGRHARAV